MQDLPSEGLTAVGHAQGKQVDEAHAVVIAAGSRLGRILPPTKGPVLVNSSHHQAVKVAGDNLRVTATSAADGVIEALELNSEDHFAVGVQWHPERTYARSSFSLALFAAFVREAESWRPQPARESAVSA